MAIRLDNKRESCNNPVIGSIVYTEIWNRVVQVVRLKDFLGKYTPLAQITGNSPTE
jgi:hypothetical protein